MIVTFLLPICAVMAGADAAKHVTAGRFLTDDGGFDFPAIQASRFEGPFAAGESSSHPDDINWQEGFTTAGLDRWATCMSIYEGDLIVGGGFSFADGQR